MKSTSKKGSRKSTRKSRSRPLQKRRASSPKDSLSKQKKTIDAQAREIREGQEQLTATTEILGVIASSPTDVQPVLDVVAERAVRLCEADDAVIFRIYGDHLQPVASYGPMPIPQVPYPLARSLPVGRAVIDRQTIHVEDIAAEIETSRSQSMLAWL